MDLKDKIRKALILPLKAAYLRLEDDDGISGFVVSSQFEDVSATDRQRMIDAALSNAANPLSPDEQRRVLMIAGLTPVEYDTVGARVRVHRVREMAGGTVEVLLHGGPSDAAYVQEVFNKQGGVHATEPKQVPGAIGVLMSLRAKGAKGDPLTKSKAISVLKSDPYIEVMANA